MELDCLIYNNLYFNKIYDNDYCIYKIECYTIVNDIKTTVNFTKFGTFNTYANSKCVIFPKGKTTREGFVPLCEFKDGDIVCTTFNSIAIIKEKSELYYNTHCVILKSNAFYLNAVLEQIRLATEEEKERLFKEIEKNG